MRHFKTVALLAAFITGSAFAVDSIPVGYGSATAEVTATGTYASAVSFTLPSGMLTIPTKQVRPGASFTVTIPVTNTTDRPITVTAATVTGTGIGDNVTVSIDEGTVTIAKNATLNLTYTVTFAGDALSQATLTGDVVLVFPMTGADAVETEDDLTVGN